MSDFPPSKETQALWAEWLEAENEGDALELDIAAFLRDERLAAALALWEAVEWSRWNVVVVDQSLADARWTAIKPGSAENGYRSKMGRGTTLPEAVSALRSKLEEGKE